MTFYIMEIYKIAIFTPIYQASMPQMITIRMDKIHKTHYINTLDK